MSRINEATGQVYPDRVRDVSYAVLATAPALPDGLSTEVALVWLMTGEYTVIHVNPKGYILEDDPIHSNDEGVARNCFGYRTAENFRKAGLV